VSNTTPDHDVPEAVVAPERDTRLIWAGLFLALAVFSKAPVVDLWVSQRWWRPGEGFFAAQTPWVQFSYIVTPHVGHAVLALAAALLTISPWVIKWLTRQDTPARQQWARHLARTGRRSALAVLLVGTISSGLLVEVTFKGHIGRPRPVQTVNFGGTQAFQGVFEIGGDPKAHKSFTSGHAAAAFTLMAFGLAASPAWRRRWFFIGLFVGSVVGLGRIIQGGHYLSDVIFSFYTVWLTCELVAYGFKRYDLSRLPPHHPARIGPRSALR
jgi:lipid A 4'-phosphatase